MIPRSVGHCVLLSYMKLKYPLISPTRTGSTRLSRITIIVCPDFIHHKGHLNPHMSVGFSHEEQAIKCAQKYTGGSYGAPSEFAIPGAKVW